MHPEGVLHPGSLTFRNFKLEAINVFAIGQIAASPIFAAQIEQSAKQQGSSAKYADVDTSHQAGEGREIFNNFRYGPSPQFGKNFAFIKEFRDEAK